MGIEYASELGEDREGFFQERRFEDVTPAEQVISSQNLSLISFVATQIDKWRSKTVFDTEVPLHPTGGLAIVILSSVVARS